jgi:hypothetical protein
MPWHSKNGKPVFGRSILATSIVFNCIFHLSSAAESWT